MITLRVDGEPAPQGSKSVSRHGGVYEKSRKVAPWRAAIKAAALTAPGQELWEELPLTGAIDVRIVFILARPRSHYRTGCNAHLLRQEAPPLPRIRPDLDKLIRSTLDGLMFAGLYSDDGQVAELTARKRYADTSAGEKPGAEIMMWGDIES